MESLEDRALMAGDVTALISGGTLVITGDADANHLVITADPVDPGHVTLSAGDGATTINGFLVDTEFTFTGDLRVSLNDGDDILEIIGDGGPGSIIPRDLLVDLGNADTQNEFSLTGGYEIGRNFRTTGKAGLDFVTAEDFSAYDSYFAPGNDGATITINRATLTRGVTTVFGHSGANVNSLAVETLSTGTGLTMQTGTGTNSADINDATIGGTAFFRLAGDTNIVNLGDSALGGVSIGGSLFVMNSNGTNINFVSLDSATVTGAASIRNGAGFNNVFITATAFDSTLTVGGGAGANLTNINTNVGPTTIAKNASFSAGAGSNTFSADGASFGGTTSITHGGGSDGAVFLGTTDSVAFTGNVNIRQGNATSGNIVVASQFSAAGSLNVTNGNGGANVVIGGFAGPVDVAGTLSVKNGNSIGGSPNFVSVDNATVGVDLVVVNGNTDSQNSILIGVDVPVSVGRNVLARHGDGGASETTLNAVDIFGQLTITARTGDDTVTLESIGTGDLTVGGVTTIDLLNGNDTLVIGVNSGGNATFGGNFSARLGNDDDTVTVGEFAVFLGTYLFDGGFGTDTIEVTAGTAFDPISNPWIRNFELVTT